MSLDSAEFVLEEAFTNLRRDRVITFATIGTVAVSIAVLGAVMLFMLNLRLWTERAADTLKVTLYVKKDTPRSRVLDWHREIARWPKIEGARIITKEEGWRQFKQDYPIGSRLNELRNPVGDKIEVWVTASNDKKQTSQDLISVATKLAALEETKDVFPSPEELGARSGVPQRIISVRYWVRSLAVLLAVAMALAGFLIIHNTSRLSLFARRREIYTMQVVGATPAFVAAPFLLEGAIHGALGALLACCLLVPTHMYLRNLAVESGWALIQLLPDDQLFYFAAVLLLGGPILGLAGSAVSFLRFLAHHQDPEAH